MKEMEEIKILVVDDLKENRYILQKILKGHNYTVETAKDGVEALEIARKKLPDMASNYAGS